MGIGMRELLISLVVVLVGVNGRLHLRRVGTPVMSSKYLCKLPFKVVRQSSI